MRKSMMSLIFVLFAFAAIMDGVTAADRCDLFYINSLNEEIGTVRVQYATSYGEPRFDTLRLYLPPGQDTRIGVQGTIKPQRIIVEMATRMFDFADLSPLEPDGEMRLEIAHEDGQPILRRLDSENPQQTIVKGEEHVILTQANRPNAVDRDFLTDCTTWEEIETLVEKKVSESLNDLGKSKEYDIEAGPIWNNEYALSRCPEAVTEWNAAHDAKAQWTGNWHTTVPGEMSVCGCIDGAADLPGTIYEDRGNWGRILNFPVFWKDWFGAAQVQAWDAENPEKAIAIDLRFRLAEGDDIPEMLDSLLSDLRVDGFRPWYFQMQRFDPKENDTQDIELNLLREEGDKYDHQDGIQNHLFSAYADASLVMGVIVWVQEDFFDKAKAGEVVPDQKGVATLFRPGTFEALFVPDVRILARYESLE